MLPSLATRLLFSPTAHGKRFGVVFVSQRFATTTTTTTTTPKPKSARTFQIKPSTPSTKPTDTPASPKKPPTPTTIPPIPIEEPTVYDDLVELDATSTLPSLRSTPPSPSNEKPNANEPKDAIKDMKAQLSIANKERSTLKQTVTLLQQENNTLKEERALVQNQLQQHSAVEAIYGDSGFVQLKNLVKELAVEEASVLRAYGFETETIDHQLEQRQKDVTVQFTTHVASDIAKHINNHLKRVRDILKQSSSAATATQQTLKNAGMPDTVITSSVASLQVHIEELQAKLSRWEKLKADVDLLLATYQ